MNIRQQIRRLIFGYASTCLLLASFSSQNAHAEDVDTGAKPTSTIQQLQSIRSFADVQQLAQRTSKKPFVSKQSFPTSLAQLTYDEYQSIRFRPSQGVWQNTSSPFWLEMFHRGFVQRDRVELFELENQLTKRIPFSTDNFSYGDSTDSLTSIDNSGFAGLKVVGRFDGQSDGQEMLTFLGSSYFRAISQETLYGSSARGLAIDIGLPKDEEFPFYRAFWIVRPSDDARQIQLLALMDSPSVAGAYQFTFTPGTGLSQVHVDCSLYFRSTPEKVGIAPLTSMWIWGDGLQGPAKDARPSVHDSDCLLIQTDDGWTCHKYARQSYPSVKRFDTSDLKGFGLLQRNRAFFHYDDHNAHYEKRPSLWVTPDENWNDGALELIELPGAHEGVDNIAAYWVPNATISPETPVHLGYSVSFFAGDYGEQKSVARVTNLEIDRAEEDITMTVRFAGEAVKNLAMDQLNIATSAIRGEILQKNLKRTETGDWIVALVFRPTEDAPIELTATLFLGDQPVSEKLSYICPQQEPEFVYPAVYTRIE